MAHRITLLHCRPAKSLKNYHRCFSTRFYPVESEYTEEPCYPPILDVSREAKKVRKIEENAQYITNLPTVEEKIIELNKPKYYGWWACQLSGQMFPYNVLPFTQFATRTCLISGLPSVYSDIDETASTLAANLKDRVCQLISQEFELVTPRTNRRNQFSDLAAKEERTVRNFVPLLNRLLISSLVPSAEHLAATEIDFQTRIASFWSLGGIEPDKTLKKMRKGLDHLKDVIDEPIDRPMQFSGEACVSLRHELPLPQFIPRDSGLSTDGMVPKWNYDPRVLGYKFKLSRAVTTPGYWPGVASEHGYLSILSRSHINIRDRFLENRDHQEGLNAQAILHSFAWTQAQACYLGFGPYTELTYPISTQTIITNGQYFSFYAYQLNTCALYHRHSGDDNIHRNVCFAVDETKLFEEVENGQVRGFNDEVLKNLVKLYLLKPVKPSHEMRPYLSPEKYISNIDDVKKKNLVEKNFKYLLSERPRHRLMDEIYNWEKIYKIDHQTRPMEAKRRFFERKEPGPTKRRLDDYEEPYVPKALREIPKKSRRGRLPTPKTIKL